MFFNNKKIGKARILQNTEIENITFVIYYLIILFIILITRMLSLANVSFNEQSQIKK